MQHSPTVRPEDSERWRIAYSVAEQLVSSRRGSATRNQTLPAESLPNQLDEKTESVVLHSVEPKHQMEMSKEEEDITPEQPNPTRPHV